MIVSEAGLDASRIAMEGRPTAIWTSVLEEERNQGKVGVVFRTLLSHYPENVEFVAAGVDYIRSTYENSLHAAPRIDLAGDFMPGDREMEWLRQQIILLMIDVATLKAWRADTEERTHASRENEDMRRSAGMNWVVIFISAVITLIVLIIQIYLVYPR